MRSVIVYTLPGSETPKSGSNFLSSSSCSSAMAESSNEHATHILKSVWPFAVIGEEPNRTGVTVGINHSHDLT